MSALGTVMQGLLLIAVLVILVCLFIERWVGRLAKHLTLLVQAIDKSMEQKRAGEQREPHRESATHSRRT